MFMSLMRIPWTTSYHAILPCTPYIEAINAVLNIPLFSRQMLCGFQIHPFVSVSSEHTPTRIFRTMQGTSQTL